MLLSGVRATGRADSLGIAQGHGGGHVEDAAK